MFITIISIYAVFLITLVVPYTELIKSIAARYTLTIELAGGRPVRDAVVFVFSFVVLLFYE